jgi:hypothetical protein
MVGVYQTEFVALVVGRLFRLDLGCLVFLLQLCHNIATVTAIVCVVRGACCRGLPRARDAAVCAHSVSLLCEWSSCIALPTFLQ